MNKELENRLREIGIEDFVFSIFIIIIIMSYIANEIEKSYFINGNIKDKKAYYYLQIVIFLIVFAINIYYVWVSYLDVVSLSNFDSYKRRKYSRLDFLASLFALLATSIILYVAITDTEIEAEISI